MDLMKVNNFDALLKGSEKTTWEAFMQLLTIFLANIRHLTIGHLLKLCLQLSELRGETCHSNFASFTVMGTFFQATLKMSLTSMVSDFTNISPL